MLWGIKEVPRYNYYCEACKTLITVFHLSTENQAECTACQESGKLVKQLTRFSTKGKQQQKKRVGQVTEDFIKEAQGELKKQKDDLEKAR